jgi:hypothetical protein
MRNDHRSNHAGTTGTTRDSGDLRRTGRWSAPAALAGLGLAVAATLALPSTADAAGPTWRCGNASADTPCPGGRRIDATAGPDEAARRAADEATRRIEQRADTLERHRLQTERAVMARDDRIALANMRLAEAQRRDAVRQAAQQSARSKRDSGSRSGGKRSGKHAATGDFVAQGTDGARR